MTKKTAQAVSFDTKSYSGGPGSSAPDVTTQHIMEGETATEPGNPFSDGYKFLGWYTSASCLDGEKYDFSTTITAPITLYAKWEGHTTHTFDKKVVDDSFLKSYADCEHAAVYYTSCE